MVSPSLGTGSAKVYPLSNIAMANKPRMMFVHISLQYAFLKFTAYLANLSDRRAGKTTA